MKRILIADDSFYQRKVLGDMVKEMGYTFDTVASGEELLEKINSSYDCVFLDLLMSGISGIEVLTRLKDREGIPPIIVISADIQKARREECLALGAKAFINKVVSKQELVNALDKIFNPGIMLSTKQIDTITEIVNIGVGKGSASLSQMVNAEVLLNVPYVNVVSFNQVMDELHKLGVDSVHAVELTFSGEYEGNANVILSQKSAAQLASLLIHEEPDSEALLGMKDGIMIEVGNIILNGIMGSFGNILDAPLDYHMPKSFEGDIKDLYQTLDKEKFSQVLICRTNFSIRGKNISGEILIMYEMNSFDKLTKVLDMLMER